MTKKDFELIADTIWFLDVDSGVRQHIAETFAANLEATNPRFDRDRFIKAATRNKYHPSL